MSCVRMLWLRLGFKGLRSRMQCYTTVVYLQFYSLSNVLNLYRPPALRPPIRTHPQTLTRRSFCGPSLRLMSTHHSAAVFPCPHCPDVSFFCSLQTVSARRSFACFPCPDGHFHSMRRRPSRGRFFPESRHILPLRSPEVSAFH